jgi:hypothetical protein
LLVTPPPLVDQSLTSVLPRSEPLYLGLDSRERGQADELPVLAANAIILAAVSLCESEDESLELLMQALLLLESCVGLRPHSAQIRLSLAALHTLVGCPEAARSHGQALDIKNIQLDSLASHHMLPALLSFYSPPTGTAVLNSSSSSLPSLLRETLYLFSDHLKEASSTLRDAYRQGSYSKVLEFIAFKERIEFSHTRALARAEKQILEMKERFFSDMSLRDPSADILMRSSMSALLPLTEMPVIDGPNRVRFNEDLSTRPPWYPPFLSAASLAPYFWWEKRKEGDLMSSKGQGRVWWSQPFASDNPQSVDGGPVHPYRSSKGLAVRQRWLLPHLLSSAFSGNVAKLQELLSMLPPVPPMDGDVKTLSLSIFSALASSLNAPSEHENLKSVEAIKAHIDFLSNRTLVALELDPEILPGWVVNLASFLVTEVFFGLCICSRALSASKGEVVNAWKDTVSHCAKSCAALSSALISRSKQSIKAESSKIVKDFTLFSSEASLPSFDAAAIVTRVAEEQRKSTAGLGEAASRLSKEFFLITMPGG